MAYDIKEISKHFGEEYDNLYTGKTVVKNYNNLIAEGDKFITEHPEFVGEFNEYRHDFLSSDREVAAFMLTIKAMNIEKELNASAEKTAAPKKTHKHSDIER